MLAPPSTARLDNSPDLNHGPRHAALAALQKRISVCVIDSGLDVNHVDIKANVAKPAGINAYSIDAAQWPNMKNDPLWYTKVGIRVMGTTSCRVMGHSKVGAGAPPAA